MKNAIKLLSMRIATLSAGLLLAALFLTGCSNNVGPAGTALEKTLLSIKVIKAPDKTEYFIRASINLNGLKVTAAYSDGSTEIIDNSELEITNFDSTTAGPETVIVSYGGKNDTFTVTVQDITLSGIEISAEPVKTSYWKDESLDLDGLVVTATFSDGSASIIGNDELTIGFDSSTTGEKTVTVTYGGKSDTFTVTVNNITLTKIEITAGPTKTSYWLYEHLDLDGLVVKATLSNGTTEILDISELGITGFDLNKTGTQTITVSSAGKTAAFTVTVAARTFTVTFNKNGGDSEANPNTKTVTQPATVIDSLPTPPTKNGYDFDGWQDANGDIFTASSSVTGNITVYAQWQQSSQPAYKIGGTGPGGGKIYYYSEEGFTLAGFGGTIYHYLEASPEDLGTVQFGANGDRLDLGDEIGDGKQNTQRILIVLNADKEDGAAKWCANYTNNGLSDWFLPSDDELYYLFLNREEAGITNLKLGSSSYYWTSSEGTNQQNAWAYYYSTSNNTINDTTRNRTTSNNVRAVRAF